MCVPARADADLTYRQDEGYEFTRLCEESPVVRIDDLSEIDADVQVEADVFGEIADGYVGRA